MFKKIILKPIKSYQRFISPLLPRKCRFYPTCSEYCVLAVKKYGAIKGCWKGLKRILKCHPWGGEGIDYP